MAEQQEPIDEAGVYRQYQKNVRLSETTQEEILQGLRRGEDPCTLLMKAAKVISLMCGDNGLFSNEVTRALSVYGNALGAQAPLTSALEAARERLQKITAAAEKMPDGEDKKRMLSAMHEHEALIASMEQQLGTH